MKRKGFGVALIVGSLLTGCSSDRHDTGDDPSIAGERGTVASPDPHAHESAEIAGSAPPSEDHGAHGSPAHAEGGDPLSGPAHHAGHAPAVAAQAGDGGHAGHAPAVAAQAGDGGHAGHAPLPGAASHAEHGHHPPDHAAPAVPAAPAAAAVRPRPPPEGASSEVGLATLITALLDDAAVQSRIQNDAELRELWSEPAVRRYVTAAPEPVMGMAGILELVDLLTRDPAVRARIEAEPALRELWSDPAVRGLLERPAER